MTVASVAEEGVARMPICISKHTSRMTSRHLRTSAMQDPLHTVLELFRSSYAASILSR